MTLREKPERSMTVFPPYLRRPALWRGLGFGAFFVLFYLYLWLRVDLRLLYHWPSPAFPSFLAGQGLFEGAVRRPGGPVEYACAFLFQYHYYAWAGALLNTVPAALLCLFTGLFAVSLVGYWPRGVHFLPGVLLLLLHDRYVYTLEMSVALVLAVGCAWAWSRMPLRGTLARSAALLAVSAFLYYLIAGAFIVWAVLCGLFELRRKGQALVAALCLAAGVVVPYVVGRLILEAGLLDAYGRLLPYHPEGDPRGGVVALCLYLFFPVTGIGLALWALFGKVLASPPGSGACRSFRVVLGRIHSIGAGLWVKPVVLALAAAVVWFSFRGGLHDWLLVECLSRECRWRELLEVARHMPLERYDFLVNRAVNRALYHEGQLLESMFSYPQSVSGLLPSHQYMKHEVLSHPADMMRLSDLLFDLGRANESARMAHEALEHMGGRPWVIQRLALVQLVKRRTDAGRAFLTALSADPIYGGWAEAYLARLEGDPSLSEDDEVARVRSLMPVEDVAGLQQPEVLLQGLVERNGRNRMAVEYLVAHYLLTRNLEAAMAMLPALEEFDVVRLPRHVEEAVLLYGSLTGKSVDLKGRKISPETIARFHQLQRLPWQSRADPAGARREALACRDTYFYYFFYAPTGQEQ
jgi:hypothetical protein